MSTKGVKLSEDVKILCKGCLEYINGPNAVRIVKDAEHNEHYHFTCYNNIRGK